VPYLRTVLDRCGFTDALHKRKDTLLNRYDCLRSVKPGDRRIDVTDYRQAIGNVIYGMVFTRPDIVFVIGKLSQYLKELAECHGTSLKGFLRYIGWTTDLQICYGPTTKGHLVLYTDADWAGNRTDCKSTSRHVAMLYRGPISWGSRKQTLVATSSTNLNIWLCHRVVAAKDVRMHIMAAYSHSEVGRTIRRHRIE
jgi:hypothetical protein